MVDIPEITYSRPLKSGEQQEVIVSSFYMAKDDLSMEDWCNYIDSLDTAYRESINSSEDFIDTLINDLWECEVYEINLQWPVFGISWLEAIEYCNWLSKKECLDACYEIVQKSDKTKIVKWNKNANGYRLPTVAEWEAVSEIYTSKFSEDYMFKTNISIYIGRIWNRNYRNKYEPNGYGLVNLTGDAGKLLWDYYNENYEDYSIKVENPTGADDFVKPDNYKPRTNIINELRICTIPCDIHKVKNYINKTPL